MGLFSFLHKNKQDAAPGKSEYRSQADEPFTNARTRAKRSTANSGNAGNKDNDSDPMLPEKKRARRRLIGAVVLVLAVVIVLPMILDPEPKPLTDDISVQIPSRDAKSPNASAPDSRQSDASGLEGREELVENKPDAAAERPPLEKPAEKIAETPVAKPADVPQPPAGIAARPAEKIAEKPAEKSAAQARTEKAEKAEKAAADAKRAADKASDKAAAKPNDEQRALAILQGKPAVNAKTKADKTDKADGKPVPAGKFVIQVAALATQEKIDELRGKLSAAGISSFIQKVATKDGDRTRIRVGPFNSREEADKARARIVKLGLNATLVPT